MGGIVDDICDGSVDPARSAECLASSGFGWCAHFAGELFHCLVPIFNHQTRQNETASLKGARGGGNLLGRSADFCCKAAQFCAATSWMLRYRLNARPRLWKALGRQFRFTEPAKITQ